METALQSAMETAILRAILARPERCPEPLRASAVRLDKARAAYNKAVAAYNKAVAAYNKARAALDEARAEFREMLAKYAETLPEIFA